MDTSSDNTFKVSQYAPQMVRDIQYEKNEAVPASDGDGISQGPIWLQKVDAAILVQIQVLLRFWTGNSLGENFPTAWLAKVELWGTWNVQLQSWGSFFVWGFHGLDFLSINGIVWIANPSPSVWKRIVNTHKGKERLPNELLS